MYDPKHATAAGGAGAFAAELAEEREQVDDVDDAVAVEVGVGVGGVEGAEQLEQIGDIDRASRAVDVGAANAVLGGGEAEEGRGEGEDLHHHPPVCGGCAAGTGGREVKLNPLLLG